MLSTRLLRAAARLWWLRTYVASAHAPLPRDTPSIRSGAEDADRVLILGNGAASGWGVLTHGLALPGQLAARLQSSTERPCDVDLLGDEVMNAASAPDWIGNRPLDAYDVVVVVLGFGDAVRQTPASQWREELDRLLHHLRDRVRPSAGVLVAGIEPVESAGVFRGPLGSLAQRNADRLNAATRELLAATPWAEFAELPPYRAAPGGIRAAYGFWSDRLAASVEPMLDRARTADADAPRLAPAQVEPTPLTGDLTALRSLVHQAKAELGADLAWVGLHEGDRQVIAVSTEERKPSSVPMDLTFCRYTEQLDDTFVVPDAPADPRFAGNPFLDVLHLESYAGHPLHDDAGRVIGTFCVASIRPTTKFGGAAGSLGRFARSAEGELQRVQEPLA